jgi:CheY-like chemotaxis protein/nitrogen-specific signal transduction histidine kinase
MAKRKRQAKPPATRTPRKAPPRAIEAALAGLAHDLRTPLTGMLALADLLAASNLPERERQWARTIKSGAEHLAALSNLIVDAARADAAGLVLQREPFSPRALAETLAETLAARAANKGLECKIAIAADLPQRAAGDVLRLRGALENLADNAVKFTSAGKIRFAAAAERARGGRLRLVFTFADTGIGLSPAEVKQLFRPYAQASAEVARRFGGAGLGLTFVKRLAKAMGGDLQVESRKGEGSTFRFSALVEPIAANTVATAPRSSRQLKKLKLLYAEDNPYARVVMNTILRELGHAVDFVDSGEAALEAVKRGGYDAVLMDVGLSGLDGLEATRRIRALPDNAKRIPIVGLSARGETEAEKAALAAGMNEYLVKPVSPETLAQMLGKIVQ